MKTVIAFAVLAVAGLSFAIIGHFVVGLEPSPRDIGDAERLSHLWLVLTALATVVAVDVTVVVLALRRRRST